MTYQQIIVVGNLGRDPEMRYTPAGKAVTNFSVADGRKWTDRDGVEHDETLWFRVSVWDKQAEACNQYLKKGSMVLVEGRITGDPETGGPKIYPRNDGFAGASFEISATTVRFLLRRKVTLKSLLAIVYALVVLNLRLVYQTNPQMVLESKHHSN